MSKRFYIPLVFFLAAMILALLFLNSNPNFLNKNQTKLTANRPVLEYFNTPTESYLSVGYVFESDDKNLYDFLGVLKSLEESNGSVFGTIQFNINPKALQKVQLAEKDGANTFLLIKQKGYDIFPTSNLITTIQLQGAEIIPILKPYIGRTIHFSVVSKVPDLDPKSNTQLAQLIKTLTKAVDCNNSFLSILNDTKTTGVSCTPYINHAYVVEN